MNKLVKLTVVSALLLSVAGCNHMRDMIACQPKVKSPALFSDANGWDHRSPEEVSCSKEAYEAAKLARIEADSKRS